MRTFYLQNSTAAQVLGVLKQMVKTRDAVLDERTNAIIMRDAPDTIKVAERIIRALDVTPAEVVIDAQVLEVSSSDLLNMGIQYPDRITFGLKSGTIDDGTTLPDNTVTLEQLHNLNSSDGWCGSGRSASTFCRRTARRARSPIRASACAIARRRRC